MSGNWIGTFDLDDDIDRGIDPNLLDPEDPLYHEDNPRVQVLLNDTIGLLQTYMIDYSQGLFFGSGEAVLTTLSNRSLFGSTAPVMTANKVEEMMIDPGYWQSNNTVPNLLVGNMNITILPAPISLPKIIDYLRKRIEAEMPYILGDTMQSQGMTSYSIRLADFSIDSTGNNRIADLLKLPDFPEPIPTDPA